MPRPYFDNHKKKLQEIIMVNHAGEYGAQAIYEGQLAAIKDPNFKALIKEMLNQELVHLAYFETQIKEGASKPTILIPLWKILGNIMGFLSAKYGAKSAMMLTEAVEEVIVEHYMEQIDYLEKTDKDSLLLKQIKQFKEEEAEHIHIAIKNESQDASHHRLISNLVRCICKVAIFISKKI